jgi:hypothetical protein
MEYKRLRSGPKSKYSDSFRRMVCEEILSGKIYQAGAQRKYSLNKGVICTWLKWYKKHFAENNEIVGKPLQMTSQNLTDLNALSQKNAQLQAALEASELKIAALETMIDVAEEKFKMNIRKKPGTKQS